MKFKAEKEIIFSDKSPQSIKQFLESLDDLSHLLTITDEEQNTPLHHCAYKNYFSQLKLYLMFAEKSLPHQTKSEQIIKWVNTQNKDGLTAIHYAAYKGNIQILDYLKNKGGNLKAETQNEVNALHLAAQTDKVETFIYYRGILGINSIDRKKSTSLHWAAFMGNNRVVSYLLAQPQIELDLGDIEEQTPLHLAAGYGNTQIVKKLLIKGADRGLRNKKKQTALEIAQSCQFKRIQKMLKEEYSCWDKTQIYYNNRTKYEPQEKSLKKPLLFLFFFLLLFGVNNGLYKYAETYSIVFYLQCTLIAFFILVYLSLLPSPSKPVNLDNNYQTYLNHEGQINKLCFDCVAEKPRRSVHCNICKTCIELYDHHCPWINNCVGRFNLKRYYGFVLTFFILLLYLIAFGSFILNYLLTKQGKIIELRYSLTVLSDLSYAVSIIDILIGVVVGFMILVLLCRQTKNLCMNQTTYERFSKEHKQTFAEEQSYISSGKNRKMGNVSLKNCCLMCCLREEKEGPELKSVESLLVEN